MPEDTQLPMLEFSLPEDVVPPSGLNDVNRKIYDDMVHYMKIKLQRPFTAPKIVMLIASGVKFLAKVKSLDGPEKKDLVLHALRETVNRSSYIKDDEKAEIIMLIDTVGDGLIDQLVVFARDGATFIKNKLKGISWCPDCVRGVNENATSHERSAVLNQTHNLEEYRTLKNYLTLKLQRPVTASKVILVIAAGVKYIEHYKDLSGAEKKDIIIQAIRDVIQESNTIPEADKIELIDVVDTFADDTIDHLVDFGKNMYLAVKKRCC